MNTNSNLKKKMEKKKEKSFFFFYSEIVDALVGYLLLDPAEGGVKAGTVLLHEVGQIRHSG